MKEEIITITKWASLLNHLRENRIEYLICVAILHIVGATNHIYSQVEGVCFWWLTEKEIIDLKEEQQPGWVRFLEPEKEN